MGAAETSPMGPGSAPADRGVIRLLGLRDTVERLASLMTAEPALQGWEIAPAEVIAVQPIPGSDALPRAMGRPSDADLLVLLSRTAATIAAAAAGEAGTIAAWGERRILAIGAGTQSTAAEQGWSSAELPPSGIGTAADLASHLADTLPTGSRVLVPRSDIADSRDLDPLRAAGHAVTVIPAYTTGGVPIDIAAWHLGSARPTMLVWLASSAVDAVRAAATNEQWAALATRYIRSIAIGPSTAATLDSAGIPVAAIADPPTLPSLCATVGRAASEPFG